MQAGAGCNNPLRLNKQKRCATETNGKNIMTQQELNQKIYLIEGFEAVETTYKDFINDWQKDDGIETLVDEVLELRYFHKDGTDISESDYDELSDEEQDEYNPAEVVTSYAWKQKRWGKTTTIHTYDTEEEAESDMWDGLERSAQNNDQAPCYFYSKEEAINDLVERLTYDSDRSEDVIRRALSMLYARNAREERERKERERQREIEREKREQRTQADIEHLKPLVDDAFRADIEQASKLTGNDKSRAQSAALSLFLYRVGYIITGDFWHVFRAIKNI